MQIIPSGVKDLPLRRWLSAQRHSYSLDSLHCGHHHVPAWPSLRPHSLALISPPMNLSSGSLRAEVLLEHYSLPMSWIRTNCHILASVSQVGSGAAN